MANTTTNYGWTKPTVGASDDVWGDALNGDLDGIDSTVKGVSDAVAAKLSLSGGTLTGSLSGTTLTLSGGANFGGGLALSGATPSLSLPGTTNSNVSFYNGSNIYSDATYYGVGLSGAFTTTTNWRDMYLRSTGQRAWYDFNNVALMSLVGGGNLTITGTLAQASDAELKTGIEDATDGIEQVRLMRPRRYHRIHAEPPADQPGWAVEDREELGFVAQEMQDALPHAVRTHGDTGMLAVELMPLIAALTNAVKQLDERLAALEAKQ